MLLQRQMKSAPEFVAEPEYKVALCRQQPRRMLPTYARRDGMLIDRPLMGAGGHVLSWVLGGTTKMGLTFRSTDRFNHRRGWYDANVEMISNVFGAATDDSPQDQKFQAEARGETDNSIIARGERTQEVDLHQCSNKQSTAAASF